MSSERRDGDSKSTRRSRSTAKLVLNLVLHVVLNLVVIATAVILNLGCVHAAVLYPGSRYTR
jgi:hypothetical protein